MSGRTQLIQAFRTAMYCLSCLLAAVFLFALPAEGQTQLLASNPQPGSYFHRHDVAFWLRFNKRIDNARCSLWLQTPAGQLRSLPLQAQTSSDQIESPGTDLEQGLYVLSWRVFTTGQPVTSGAIPFTVR